ncbi:MAG: predicted protein [uncultured Friedmanniella sp.]|uniref:Polysaccharide pyruvyl transferase domain-containing protein n=1 Tax=uncultured Friedmanniella sp. TaxID=335381 RepID=A0A6J4LHM0_9ACTN|nr:polysaccharide pyruvyl transferase family protein [uncultured Friedmanniella sp.]CAA9330957.1 MAG: predicted protein [uncultured Friedmanniella sp.]
MAELEGLLPDRQTEGPAPERVRRLRLFHFDIKTLGNYGDTLLFEAVRQVFNGFGGGRYFEVTDSRPLRDPVGPALVRHINENVDAVVIGGGGLFLRDTNANQRSGWQWNISLDLLRRIEKPLIIFGVGNNRFIDQEDFAPPFVEHVNLVLEKSVFFGLRNTGSMETIRPYLDPANHHRVEFQPCPTTLSSYLFPDLWRSELPDERRLGLQMIVGRRQERAGFSADAIYTDVLEVVRRLRGDGWSIESVPHARADLGFAERAEREGALDGEIRLFNDPDGLYKGVEYFAGLPFLLGTRGHAQMVPFGMGSIPLSLHVHHKTGYFARDIGHPELTVDPRAHDFVHRLYAVVNEAAEHRVALRKELAEVRAGFYQQTMDNLSNIYRRITGRSVTADHLAYTPFARGLSARGFLQGLHREAADARVRSLTAELGTVRDQPRTETEVRGWLDRRAREAAAARDLATARALRRALEAVAPEHDGRVRPRWDSGPLRAVPAPLLDLARGLLRR